MGHPDLSDLLGIPPAAEDVDPKLGHKVRELEERLKALTLTEKEEKIQQVKSQADDIQEALEDRLLDTLKDGPCSEDMSAYGDLVLNLTSALALVYQFPRN